METIDLLISLQNLLDLRNYLDGLGLEWVKTCDDVFCIFEGREVEWNECRWELNIKIIKVAQMAKK